MSDDALVADLYTSGNVLVDEIERLRALLGTLIRDPRVPRDAIEDAISSQGAVEHGRIIPGAVEWIPRSPSLEMTNALTTALGGATSMSSGSEGVR